MSPHPFWDWSLAVYGQPDVKAACLDLQNRYDLNVNMLLWICWLSAIGKDPLDLLNDAQSSIAHWNIAITSAIREIRLRIDKDSANAVYQHLLKSELEAEKVEQERLFQLSNLAPVSQSVPMDTALKALSAYTQNTPDHVDIEAFAKIVFTAVKKV